jgi:phytoene dehydrogenase-like protein
MKVYDDIVVGSGIAGMTMALLLGRAGRKVLLLEIQSTIGGCMRRFTRGGIPFDTGFHFTGGFDDLLSDMLDKLGIAQDIEPVSLESCESNHIYFDRSRDMYDLPSGLDHMVQALCEYFPGEHAAINKYFQTEADVKSKTPFMDLYKLNNSDLEELLRDIEEDYISLKKFLDSISDNEKLKAILAGFSLCYGSPPSQTPLASHCRASYNLHQKLSRVKNGGQAFIDAFKKEFKNYDIEIKTNCTIKSVENISRRKAASVILSDGTECAMQNCIMTIHPRAILDILPAKHVPDTVRATVDKYEESIAFFSIFAEIDCNDALKTSLTSVLSSPDLDRIISQDDTESAMAILISPETVNGKTRNTLCAFKTDSYSSVDAWRSIKNRRKDPSYQQFKAQRAATMIAQIEEIFPEYKNKIKLLDSSSVLTFADYIPPYGSAYGVMHKLGESSLWGRLPIRNFYMAGQSAILPGLVGAMLSSFISARFILGKNFC